MGKLSYIIILVGMLTSVYGQQELKRADTYFKRAFYSDAIPLYEQSLPRNKSSRLIKNLADCYYNTYNMKAAARWYKYLISNYGEKIDHSYYFKLNQSLKALGEYQEAHDVLLNRFTAKKHLDKVAKLKEDIVYLENVRAIGERFTIENLALNTATSEFGAVKMDSVLVYNSARKKSGGLQKLYRWNNQHYLDIYIHPVDKMDLGDSLSVPLSPTINTKMHEGTFVITKDKKTLYFTRNSKKKTDPQKISHLKIYKAEWINGDWKNSTELPFNGEKFSSEHPMLNSDETRLYFASDREGGFGSFDLYYVDILPDGSYGHPINLGQEINTDKKEQFPFLDQKDNLYFSSNGHPGFGLLDVFISKNENGIFQKPDNLGLPLNSGYDDFSFTLDKNGKQGFFASNRPGGKGSDDIYTFIENKPLIIEDCKQFIAGILTDRTTKLPIAQGEIRLLDTQGKVLEIHITGNDAIFMFQVACASKYRIEAQKEGYDANFKIVVTDTERNAKKDGSLELYSIEERKKQEALALQKKKEEAEKKAKAEIEKRQKEEALAKAQKIREEKERKVRAEKRRQQKIEDIIQNEEAVVRENNRVIVKTEEIHFDYSLWYLRRESRERLGNLIQIMKDNPEIVIEVGSHTDVRGNSEYNRQLSQKRADSVRDYIIKKGIAEDRIIAKGYGESEPIVLCDANTKCTEEDHEWNRRCEFVVVDWN